MAHTRKEEILERSAHLFKEHGYNGASMRTVAESVGIEAASLYNHIKSKSEILQAICFKVANQFMAHIDSIEKSGASSTEKVQAVLSFHIRQMLENFDSVYVADHEWKHLPEPYLSNFRNQRRVYRKRFASMIEEGIRKGEFKAIDAPTAVLIILHAVSGIQSWHRSSEKISAEELEKNMILILVEGLKKTG